ncbi:MAG: competence/damage-inducible protein A [Phycisphaerales bacterium]
MTHRSAAILSIGDELVLGQTLDTNAQRLASLLLDCGVIARRHVTVDDDEGAIADELTRCAASHDLVIVTGGLGPTADDLTRHALARAIGDPLEIDEKALSQVRAWFESSGRSMPEANAVQAKRPRSAVMLENTHGTAPGIRARVGRADVFCLPGPPREMLPMFERFVAPALSPAGVIVTRVLRTSGLGESTIAGMLGSLMDRSRNPLVGTTAAAGVVSCRIRYEGDDREAGRAAVDAAADEVRERLGAYIFGEGETTPAEAVVGALSGRGERVTTVESCTGGMIAAAITSVPGSSAVLDRAVVTYANSVKVGLAGVDPAVLDTDGAVSRRCVEQMAAGGLVRSGADYAIAVSGIAGPDGGSSDKPVGTVWIALASRTGVDARRFLLKGDRANIRGRSVTAALGMLWLTLRGEPGLPVLGQVDQ